MNVIHNNSHPQPDTTIDVIRSSLATGAASRFLTSLPTFLIRRPSQLDSWKVVGHSTAADFALAFYSSIGLDGERTRKDLLGYPGLLRELSNPPPWVELEPEDIDGDLDPQRARDLSSLILQTQSSSNEELVAFFRAELEERNSLLRRFIGLPSVSAIVVDNRIESFRRLLSLARALNLSGFETVYDSVFDFDEFDVKSGVPDLLLWLPDQIPSLWFFSEVKAPGDYLGSSQKSWLHEHWGILRGHYCLTVLE